MDQRNTKSAFVEVKAPISINIRKFGGPPKFRMLYLMKDIDPGTEAVPPR
jgi:hypothetical protein